MDLQARFANTLKEKYNPYDIRHIMKYVEWLEKKLKGALIIVKEDRNCFDKILDLSPTVVGSIPKAIIESRIINYQKQIREIHSRRK